MPLEPNSGDLANLHTGQTYFGSGGKPFDIGKVDDQFVLSYTYRVLTQENHYRTNEQHSQ